MIPGALVASPLPPMPNGCSEVLAPRPLLTLFPKSIRRQARSLRAAPGAAILAAASPLRTCPDGKHRTPRTAPSFLVGMADRTSPRHWKATDRSAAKSVPLSTPAQPCKQCSNCVPAPALALFFFLGEAESREN